jgi:hypothetical protein
MSTSCIPCRSSNKGKFAGICLHSPQRHRREACALLYQQVYLLCLYPSAQIYKKPLRSEEAIKKRTPRGNPSLWAAPSVRSTGSPRAVPKGRYRPGLPQEGPVQTPQGRACTYLRGKRRATLCAVGQTPPPVGFRMARSAPPVKLMFPWPAPRQLVPAWLRPISLGLRARHGEGL